eukprot:7850682-Pyramimonas_sp.AAC.1
MPVPICTRFEGFVWLVSTLTCVCVCVCAYPQVINKTDLAEAVGASLDVMKRDATRMRDGGPFVFTQ